MASKLAGQLVTLLYFVFLLSGQVSARSTNASFQRVSKRNPAKLLAEKSSKSTEFVSGRCSKEEYNKGSAYQHNVQVVFTNLVAAIDLAAGVWDGASDPYDNAHTIYGVAGCSGLTEESCELCIKLIKKNLKKWCPHRAMSAEITLKNCFLRYDNYYIKLPARMQTL